MTRRWVKTSFPGVRYREHPRRKHGIRPDRYFAIRLQVDGRQREEGVGWASQGWTASKAALLLAELREAARTGRGETTLAARRAKRRAETAGEMPFERFWAEIYFPAAAVDKTPATVTRERSFFNRWLQPFLGRLPLRQIAPIHAERIKREMLQAGLAPRSVQYALAVLRQALNVAKRRGLFTGENPVCGVRVPRFDNARERFLTPAEARALLAALRETAPDVHDAALISLHAGLRAGEILKLRWGDVDLNQGFIAVRDTKSGRNRVAFVTEELKTALAARPRSGREEPIFQGLKVASLSRSFARVVRRLGLNDGVTDRRRRVVFHSLRHSYASLLVQRGVDLYVVGKLLGHATQAMAARYSHLAADSLRRATSLLEEVLSDEANPRDAGAAESSRPSIKTEPA